MVPAGAEAIAQPLVRRVHADQNVGGYKTLNLLNANGDPTFVRTALFSEIARKYIPPPRPTSSASSSTARAGASTSTSSSSTRISCGTSTDEQGCAVEGAGSPRGRAGLEYLGDTVDFYKRHLRAEVEGRSQGVERSRSAVPPAQHDAAGEARGGAGAAPRRRRRAQVPRARHRARQHRRLLDARQRLQPVPGRARRFHVLPYDFNEALGVQGGGRRGGYASGPTLDPLAGVDDLSSRSARGCWRCRRYVSVTSPTCATSPRSGWTGTRWPRWSATTSR